MVGAVTLDLEPERVTHDADMQININVRQRHEPGDNDLDTGCCSAAEAASIIN